MYVYKETPKLSSTDRYLYYIKSILKVYSALVTECDVFFQNGTPVLGSHCLRLSRVC